VARAHPDAVAVVSGRKGNRQDVTYGGAWQTMLVLATS
jgi:hypothetical protein